MEKRERERMEQNRWHGAATGTGTPSLRGYGRGRPPRGHRGSSAFRGRSPGHLVGRGGQFRGRVRGRVGPPPMPTPPPPPRRTSWRPPAPSPSPNTEMLLPAKPWQSDYLLRTETQLRDSLKSASKRSRTAEDLDRYRKQRKKVSELAMQLMCVYFRNNPGKEEFWLPLLAMEAAQSGRNHCDVCETGFESEAALFNHEENDHDICGLEGCTVTGSVIVLEEHALLIHSSGLYRIVLPVV